MKRWEQAILIFAVIMLVFMAGFVGYTEAEIKQERDFYPETFMVIGIEWESDTVTVQNSMGYIFQFCGIEDWEIGDCCSAIMDSRGTEVITDDVIVKVYYEYSSAPEVINDGNYIQVCY